MARCNYFFTISFLLLTSLISNVVARPINVDYVGDAMAISSFVDIKIGGGPSEGGKGHEFPNAGYFGNIKNSGPSPGGKGHDFTNDKTLGGIKNSGPSAGGKGHGFSNSIYLGSVKNSGPSHGGEGH
ncbi:hypothetical protein LXL04_019227 [Taraxacum kok-saghyz]